MDYKLTNAELALLSLLNEAPRHGYEIEKLIKERGMREWTEIAFSSIYYLLKRLEKKGFIAPVIFNLEAENNKEKKAYYITQQGREGLYLATKNSLETITHQSNPLMLAMANWPIFENDEGIYSLKRRKNSIQREIERLREKAKQPDLPLFVSSMFDYALMQLASERKWIIRTIKKMGEEKMKKEDLKKQLKELYQPSSKEFSIIDVPKMRFVMVDGEGSPDSKAFSQAMTWLYSVIYPIKFIAKKKYGKDFVAPPLEALWWADDMNDFIKMNKDKWKWRLMIVTPSWAGEDLFNEAREKAIKKLGEVPKELNLRFEYYDEGKAVQILHIGPYDEEGPTIAKMHNEFMPQNGLAPNGYHHEIYLNDPRRVAPEKLKTIIRQPVRQI